ncbi:MAG: fibronectin type III domain-containing protein [Candidatus Kapabacteria bacterium]|nr:fibronectin type III domain-containing protein [Candidatus Kapabacteria bacterium]
MSTDYIPKPDPNFQDWLGNFITVANANLVALGLLSTEMTQLSTDKSDFDTAITDNETKRAAAKAATERKKVVRGTAETYARALVKRIQAKVGVPTELKAQLQITVPGSTPPTPPIPFPPMDLVANVVGSGTYELTWKRNGNSTNTLFAIEAIIGGSHDWVGVITTSKTSYIHQGNIPGVKIIYQVRAQKGTTFGPPSNIAVVNDSTVPVSPV